MTQSNGAVEVNQPAGFYLRRAVVGWLDRWSRHPGWCILFAGLATFGIRAALLPIDGFPVPSGADEFGYLLGSDTFASGRLTNPVHPLAASFESIQILVRPSYSSKYQPGQALFLALGQKLFGHPFYGVMISVALLTSALSWMLFGWTDRRWALAMSFYPVLYFTAAHYWMDSYWGGAVVALGAALVLGAYPRLLRGVQSGTACLLALGLGLIFLSRPYEGGTLALAVMLLLVWHFRQRPKWATLFRWPMVLPLLILVTAGTFQLCLNRAVTGSVFTVPYTLHLRVYEIPPVLWVVPGGQPPHLGPAPAVRQQHYEEYIDYQRIRDGLPQSFFLVSGRVLRLIFLLCYPAALIPFLLAPLREDRLLLALAACGLLCYVSLIVETWMFAHYAAALYVVAFAFIGRALWKTSLRLGSQARLALEVAAAAFLILAPLARHAYELRGELTGHGHQVKYGVSRAAIDKSLASSGQRQLVFVRYLPGHVTDQEWVYNHADIDNSAVVWARDLGQEQNDRVIAYYGKSRQYWLLEADQSSVYLKPYETAPHSALVSHSP